MNKVTAEKRTLPLSPDRAKWKVALPWAVAGVLAAAIVVDKGTILYRSWCVEQEYRQQSMQAMGWDCINDASFVPNDSPAALHTATLNKTLYFQEESAKMLIAKLSPTVSLWVIWREGGKELYDMQLIVKGQGVLSVVGHKGRFPSRLGMVPLTGPDVGYELIDSNWDGIYEMKLETK